MGANQFFGFNSGEGTQNPLAAVAAMAAAESQNG
jgi:hypothetical protein